MVKKDTRQMTSYMCEVCHNFYQKKQSAIDCEKQTPQKVAFEIEEGTTTDWRVGDVIITHHHDDREEWRIGIIVEERTIEHKIIPVFEFLTRKEREQFDRWKHEDVVILNDAMKHKVREWSNLMVVTDRVS